MTFGPLFMLLAGMAILFNLQLESRTAYVVTYNTYATAKAGIPPESGIGADWLDREIRNYLFKNVFPLLGGEN